MLTCGVVVGLLSKHWLGYVIAAGIVLATLVAIVIYIVRSGRALARLRTKLTAPTHWPEETVREGYNPYADDRVMGTLNGRRVWAALHATGATAKIELLHWPATLSLHARDESAAIRTGDDSFDRVVQLRDPDDVWRTVLTGELRRRLVEQFGSRKATIANGILTVELPDEHSDELDDLLEAWAAIDLPPATVSEDAVFANAKVDPIAGVRRSHYEWLLLRRWNPPLVYRAAADDSDPDIAAWGRQHVPPDAGAFR